MTPTEPDRAPRRPGPLLMVVIGLRVAILVPATLAAFALVQGPSLPGVAIVLALLAVLVAFERLALRPAAVRDASRCDDE